MYSEAFDIVRNGTIVARIVPPATPPPTVRDLRAYLAALDPGDADFARDLGDIQRGQPPLEDPWER